MARNGDGDCKFLAIFFRWQIITEDSVNAPKKFSFAGKNTLLLAATVVQIGIARIGILTTLSGGTVSG